MPTKRGCWPILNLVGKVVEHAAFTHQLVVLVAEGSGLEECDRRVAGELYLAIIRDVAVGDHGAKLAPGVKAGCRPVYTPIEPEVRLFASPLDKGAADGDLGEGGELVGRVLVFADADGRRAGGGGSIVVGPAGCRAAIRANSVSFDAASAGKSGGACFDRIRALCGSEMTGGTGLMTAADIVDNRRRLFFWTCTSIKYVVLRGSTWIQ